MSESNFSLLWQGLFIGLAVAAPVGPISILCIQRSIKKGFVSGFVSGLGASTGDAIYAFVGAFGLNLIAVNLINQKTWLSLIGGLFLCYLGIRTFLEKPVVCIGRTHPSIQVSTKKGNLWGDYVTTLMLNQVNPITVLMFAAVFTRSYSKNVHSSFMMNSFFVLGVFLSTTLWRVGLSGVANRFCGRLNPRQLQRINWIAGTALFIFGCVSVYSAWR